MVTVQEFLAGLGSHRDWAMVLAMLLGTVQEFLAGLGSHRDWAMVLAMLLGDVDQGRRRLRVVGKGGRERIVPVDYPAFFAELAAYLRQERPPRLGTPQCSVVLRGPSTGAPVSEAGLRSLFRRHRLSSGAVRGPTAPVAPHLTAPS